MEIIAPGIRIVERASIVSKMIGAVESHWRELRKYREMPMRSDLDPIGLKAWLPYLSTIELHDNPFRIRYRVVGTEVARFSGEDFTGRWLHETGWTELAKQANLAIYQRTMESRQPTFGVSGLAAESDKAPFFEWGLFPMTTDGTTITHCLSIDDLSALGRRSRLAGLDRNTE